MNLPVKHPFESGPKTLIRQDDKGRPAYLVKARALTPLSAKIADGSAFTLAASVSFGGTLGHLAMTGLDAGWEGIAFWLGGMLLYPPLKWGFRKALNKTRRICIDAETISIQGSSGWTHLSRHTDHSFTLSQHEKTKEELIRNEIAERKAAMKGKVERKPRYYADSYHLDLLHAGTRYRLMDILTLRKAEDILSRLTACDAASEAALKYGKGLALSADDNWSKAAGALPAPKEKPAMGLLPAPAPRKQLEDRRLR